MAIQPQSTHAKNIPNSITTCIFIWMERGGCPKFTLIIPDVVWHTGMFSQNMCNGAGIISNYSKVCWHGGGYGRDHDQHWSKMRDYHIIYIYVMSRIRRSDKPIPCSFFGWGSAAYLQSFTVLGSMNWTSACLKKSCWFVFHSAGWWYYWLVFFGLLICR